MCVKTIGRKSAVSTNRQELRVPPAWARGAVSGIAGQAAGRGMGFGQQAWRGLR